MKFRIWTGMPAPSMDQTYIEIDVANLAAAKQFARESHAKTQQSTSVTSHCYCYLLIHREGNIGIDR